MKVFESYTA